MTPTVTDQRQRPQELLKRIGPALYREAYEAGGTLSAWLEREDPSEGYHDGLDAFGRLLKVAGIRVRSIPEQGIFASTYGELFENANTRALFPEWCARQWRQVAYGRNPSTRALYASGDTALGTALRPYTDADDIRATAIAPAIPISEVVAITTPIEGNVYRAAYLTDDATQARLVRVGEGAELPRAKLVSGQHTINLYKYGRMLEATYEQLRRQRMDMIRLHIQRMAVQAEVDKLATILDVLVNGDGNSGTAATNYNASTLDSASTGGALTLKAWLSFKMKFANPYMLTHVLGQEASALLAMTLNTGSGNVPLVTIQAQSGFGTFRPINRGLADNVGLGWTSDAPSGVLVGIDGRFAIERVTEIGSTIQEVERFVSRQTEGLAMSENEGYATFAQSAVKTLTLA